MAKNDETKIETVQYETLIPVYKETFPDRDTGPVGILFLSGLVLGAAGFLRWKGFI